MEKQIPQYWGSLEELNQSLDVKENLGKEFSSPPLEQEFGEMDRRNFLKVMGASLLFATASACFRRPVEKIIPYVNRPEEVLPGIPVWYASSCTECSVGCGILVKTREGRPIKLEGNPNHPVNQGALCARGQASLLNLYDPDRLKNPLIVKGPDSVENSSWQQVDEKIKTELSKLKGEGKKVAILSGPIQGPSALRLIQEFLTSINGSASDLPNNGLISYDPTVPEELFAAHQLSFGQAVAPQYKIDGASYILSLGADFLGTWLSPVEFSKAYSRARRAEKGSMLRLVAFEPVLSLTGTNADEYFPIKPGDELWIALALAHELIVARKLSSYSSDNSIIQALTPYSIENISKEIGLESKVLKQLARELWEARGKGIVFGGALKAKSSVALQIVVNLLNSALENYGSTLTLHPLASSAGRSSYQDLQTLSAAIRQNKIGALFIHKTNPLFTLPSELGFADLLKKVPLVVSLADRLDETASAAHYVCPDHNNFESWNDVGSERKIYGVVQPTISPMYQTRSFQDSLIQWASLPHQSWYLYLKSYWEKESNFATSWNEVLQKGFVNLGSGQAKSSLPFLTDSLKAISPNKKGADKDLLSLYCSITVGDGRSANNAWLRELPDPISKVAWENYLAISPQAAEKRGLKQGDVVRVRTGQVNLELPVLLQPKLHEKSFMVAVGYGRPKSFGQVASEWGVNTFPLQRLDAGYVEWSGQPFDLEKTGKVSPLAITQGHPYTEGRPVVKEASLTEYQKHPEEAFAEHPAGGHEGEDKAKELPSLWKKDYDYSKSAYRWGMAIDLNACIGCNSCMAACQVENNIPVVGKDQVMRGRSMHWIRVDRYYSGSAKNPTQNPDVIYQPMLCQHCENAPCETVCPVIATAHNEEGLSMQIYNRCVGTRYCANNCPYKVRRFNFLEYFKDLREPMNLVFNPEVTVRSRGVMEKCSFCIQRIEEEKDKMRGKGLVKDGQIKTACQQTCPTDAITFGNTNDEKSQVVKLRKLPRGFKVLEELNVKPQITYLGKLRNKAEA